MVSGYQTFPIHSDTYKGTASGEAPRVEKLLRANADATITFTFTDATTLAITVLSGFDCALGQDVESVTSNAEILLS